jgi:Putative porin
VYYFTQSQRQASCGKSLNNGEEMKALLTWFTIFVLAANGLAQTAAAPAKPKKRAHKAAAAPPAPPAVTADDLKALRDSLAQQQAQIQEMQSKMAERDAALQQTQQQLQQAQSQLQDAQTKATSAVTTASQTSDSVTKLQTDVADIRTNTTNAAVSTQEDQKKISALASAMGRFRFSGDVRVRGESFIQNGIQDRNRARIRVRLGLEGALNQDFMGGIAIATGSQGDPTTTNETLTNFFDRKTIALDKGYITYNPVAHNWFSATGGKFAYLWQRTPVTGDTDLNPEGFDAKLSFNVKNGFFTNFTLQGLTLLYGESSGGQDSYVLGAQAQTSFKAGPWSATASFLNQHWNNPDAILRASAFAVGATTTGGTITIPGTPPVTIPVSFPVPGEGPGCASGSVIKPAFAPCIFAPNGMSNATTVDASGKPHFFSGFDLADFILNNTIKTPAARFPITLLLEFEDNLDAQAHPLDTTGKVIASIGSQNKEYGGDVSIGQTKNKNDLQFGYGWWRQEQDSVLASIAESDQRSPTNILQHKIYANWKLRANTVAQFTWWRGRVLNSFLENNAALLQKTITTAGTQEPYLNRLQFDLVYTY